MLLGQSHGPDGSLGLTVACSGAGLLTGFVFWTLHAKAPLLQLRLLANRMFAAGAAVMFFGGAINFGAQIISKRDPK